jgi:hypothetical protein
MQESNEMTMDEQAHMALKVMWALALIVVALIVVHVGMMAYHKVVAFM